MYKFMTMITLDEFIKVAVGEIYYLAPKYKPRYIQEIVNGIIENFKKDSETYGVKNIMYYHNVPLKNLKQFISDILMPIDKFRELNLSQKEYDAGINVDDEGRAEFVFTSMYTEMLEEDNFIDLDACIQNIFTVFEHNIFHSWHNDGLDIKDLINFRKLYGEDTDDCGESNND